MFLGRSSPAFFGNNNFLGKETLRPNLLLSVAIRPITEQLVEQILLHEMTVEDIETLRFSAEEGEENREAKWSNLLIRLTTRLRRSLGVPEEPIITVIEEPDLVTVEVIRPTFSMQKHLLVLP